MDFLWYVFDVVCPFIPHSITIITHTYYNSAVRRWQDPPKRGDMFTLIEKKAAPANFDFSSTTGDWKAWLLQLLPENWQQYSVVYIPQAIPRLFRVPIFLGELPCRELCSVRHV